METINASAFSNLTKTEQVILIIKQGEELLIRNENDYSIHLYSLFNLFVELWYAANSTRIVKTRLSNRDLVIIEYPTIEENVQVLLTTKNAIS